MSQRRANRSTAAEELDPSSEEAIKECVRYIVCREGSKIPIKRAEILKHLSSNFQVASNQINLIISEANKILKRVYGYKLVQVEAKGGVQYITILTQDCSSLSSTAVDETHKRILTAALTHIFMTGGPVNEEDMWKFLEEAGLLEENDLATKKVLTGMFIKQLYLTHTKVGDGDLARNVFDWGQRATEEVSKMFLLERIAEALGKTPDYWCEQFKEASEDRGAVAVE